MLSGTKNRRTLLRQVTVMAVALSVLCLVLTALSVQDRPDGVSVLSKQDMENIFGGLIECINCDDCDDVFGMFDECFHNTVKPVAPNCDVAPHLCIRNWLDTASCQPNQGEDAEGCDASTQDPDDHMVLQEIYHDPGGTCFWLDNTWSVYENIYFGCDFGVLKTCLEYPIWWACFTAWCPGTYVPGLDNPKGVKLYCAVCS